MGVKGMWKILSPAKTQRSLKSLSGQTVAVDLSIWVCEDESVRMMQGVVTKPYLRNLFFRVSHLLQLGINLVVVIEGRAPKVKWEEMARRQQRGRGRRPRQQGAKAPGRSQHGAKLRECCELLRSLGVPYIEAAGEAEAMCACLNAAGIVDGCITDDGDAFLYGARVVYKNFTMNSKTSQDSHVEMFCMDVIEEKLGLTRNHLVGLGLLLGCDYVPKGVPGVGVETALKLLEALRGKDILSRFDEWRKCPGLCVGRVEDSIRLRALAISDFPFYEVVSEFLHSKEKPPLQKLAWQRPAMEVFQAYVTAKLEWEPDYSLDKVLPLVTLWDQKAMLEGKANTQLCLRPERIVKKRVCQGLPVYEVEWMKPSPSTLLPEDKAWVTLEEQEMFQRCFPQTAEEFTAAKLTSKQNKKRGATRKAVPTAQAELVSQMSALGLQDHRAVPLPQAAMVDATRAQQKGSVSKLAPYKPDSAPIVIEIDSDDSDIAPAPLQERAPAAFQIRGDPCSAKESEAVDVQNEKVAVKTEEDEESGEEEEEEDEERRYFMLPFRLRVQAQLEREKLAAKCGGLPLAALTRSTPAELFEAPPPPPPCIATAAAENLQVKQQHHQQQESARRPWSDDSPGITSEEEDEDNSLLDDDSVILAGNANWSWKGSKKQTAGLVSCWDVMPRLPSHEKRRMSDETPHAASNLSAICEMMESERTSTESASSCRLPGDSLSVSERESEALRERLVHSPLQDMECAFLSGHDEMEAADFLMTSPGTPHWKKKCHDQPDISPSQEDVENTEWKKATTETPVNAGDVSHDFSHVNLDATVLTPTLSSFEEDRSLLTSLCRTPKSKTQSTPSLWHHNIHHTPHLCDSLHAPRKSFATLQYGNFVLEHSLLQASWQPDRDTSRNQNVHILTEHERSIKSSSDEESTLRADSLEEEKSKESSLSFLVSKQEPEARSVEVPSTDASPGPVTRSADSSHSKGTDTEPGDSLSDIDVTLPQFTSLADRIKMKMSL